MRTAGNWEIQVRGAITAQCTSGTGVTGINGALLLTDNSNNILYLDRAGFANATIDSFFSNYNFKYNVSITTATTYKLRFGIMANSGNPTCSSVSLYATDDSPVYFLATRIS